MTGKNAGALERVIQSGKMISVRVDPKIRYLAEIAAEARGESITKYLEWALGESFKNVTLRPRPEPEPTYGHDGTITMAEPPNSEDERVKNEAMSIGNLADQLWSESEFSRIQSLSILASHQVSEENAALYQYIRNRKELHIPSGKGYKLNRAKIDSEWDSIKADFAKSRKGK